MIKLEIDNSESKIEGLSLEQHRILAELMSYTLDPKAAHFSGFGARRISLLSKRGVFPTGLLYICESFLRNTSFERYDHRRVPMPLESKLRLSLRHTPYPVQIEAAKAVFKAHRGIVVAPTGVGKSVIAALIIDQLQVSTLIIVPSLELKRQLTESLVSVFGESRVGQDKDICVQNIDSVKIKRNYDCVIIDEYHHSASKTYRNLNKKILGKTYYRVGLTATPFRSQDHERLLLESILAEVIYQIPYTYAVEKGYIVPMEAYYYELPLALTASTQWAHVYSDLVVNNQTRNEIIANLLKSLKGNGKSTLCLVKEIKHGEAISNSARVHFANGVNNDTKDLIQFFSADKLKALIGTTGVLGEGIDTKPAEFIIIAGLGKSKNQFMQQVGRGFRKWPGKESCKIILFADSSHKWTRDHFKAQCKILKEEYGIVPIKLDINNANA